MLLTSGSLLHAVILAVFPLGFPLSLTAQRGTVLTDQFWSPALGARKRYVVYLPPSYRTSSARRYPVAYYLHGMWGRETDWVELGHLDQAMDSLIAHGTREMLIVMPDGDDGWYTTWASGADLPACRADTERSEPASTYCVPTPRYNQYIARDLVHQIDSVYRTIPDRAHRGIAGLSMGGYGAVTLALEYPEIWAAAASHSGVLSPLFAGPHPLAGSATYAVDDSALRAGWGPNWWHILEPRFGSTVSAWRARDPAHYARALLASRPGELPAFFIDVGRDDGLADENRAFHQELGALGVPHKYAEWAGKHDWEYWRAHVGESLAWLGERLGP